jgi:hypothetical protein
MTTAIVGLGNIGSRVASNLVSGGERVVLAGHDRSTADSMAEELGELASSADVADAVSEADSVVLALWLDDEMEVIGELSSALDGKVVIDTANPVGSDGQGGYARTLPEGQSAASIIASLLPEQAHYAKAFGAIGADDLAGAANRQPDRAAMFYATDDQLAARTAERLIHAAGFDPVRVGGIEMASRIEMGGGDLHEFGGLNGRLLTMDEAMAAV